MCSRYVPRSHAESRTDRPSTEPEVDEQRTARTAERVDVGAQVVASNLEPTVSTTAGSRARRSGAGGCGRDAQHARGRGDREERGYGQHGVGAERDVGAAAIVGTACAAGRARPGRPRSDRAARGRGRSRRRGPLEQLQLVDPGGNFAKSADPRKSTFRCYLWIGGVSVTNRPVFGRVRPVVGPVPDVTLTPRENGP